MLSTNQRAGLVQATNGKARLAVSSTTNYRTHYFDLCGQGSKQTFTLRWFVARLASIATEGHFELWGGQGGTIANYFVWVLSITLLFHLILPSKGHDFCDLLYSPLIFAINRSWFLPFTLFVFFLKRSWRMLSNISPYYNCEQILESRMGQNWFVAWLDYLSKGFERGGLLISILYFFNQQQYGKRRHRCFTASLGRVSRTHKMLYY